MIVVRVVRDMGEPLQPASRQVGRLLTVLMLGKKCQIRKSINARIVTNQSVLQRRYCQVNPPSGSSQSTETLRHNSASRGTSVPPGFIENKTQTGVRLAICDCPSLATVVSLNDLGTAAPESQNRKPDPRFYRFAEAVLKPICLRGGVGGSFSLLSSSNTTVKYLS